MKAKAASLKGMVIYCFPWSVSPVVLSTHARNPITKYWTRFIERVASTGEIHCRLLRVIISGVVDPCIWLAHLRLDVCVFMTK